MDFDPKGLLEHYSHLSPIARKHLELTEDDLLAGVMHNLIAFMVMARIPPDLVCRKIRRLIAKSHTGLHYTQKITQLLDSLEWLVGSTVARGSVNAIYISLRCGYSVLRSLCAEITVLGYTRSSKFPKYKQFVGDSNFDLPSPLTGVALSPLNNSSVLNSTPYTIE